MVNIPQTGLIGAEAALDPFTRKGTNAFNVLAAQSGGQGAVKQQRAFDSFASSPGQQFLRDQQEEAILRNASAVGGLGGGNVLSELQNEAFGRAQTDLGNQQDLLAQLATGGLTASRDVSGARTRAGEQIASNLSGTTSSLANLLSGAGTASSASTSNLAQILANIAAGQGSQISSLGGIPGVQQTGGNIEGAGQLASGFGAILDFFA